MNIIESKRKCKCKNCWKPITQKYKVVVGKNNYYHLGCYFKHLKRSLENLKRQYKEFSKQKYKRQMILEGLER